MKFSLIILAVACVICLAEKWRQHDLERLAIQQGAVWADHPTNYVVILPR